MFSATPIQVTKSTGFSFHNIDDWTYQGVVFENWIGVVIGVALMVTAIYYFIRGMIEEHLQRRH